MDNFWVTSLHLPVDAAAHQHCAKWQWRLAGLTRWEPDTVRHTDVIRSTDQIDTTRRTLA
jgi:hypothetical protein